MRVVVCVSRLVGVFCILRRQGLQINLKVRTELATFRERTRKFAISFLIEFPNNRVFDGVRWKKRGRARQATNYNIIRRYELRVLDS